MLEYPGQARARIRTRHPPYRMSADPISQALGAAFGLSRDGRHTEALAALDAIGTHAASDPRVQALRGRVLWQGGDAIGARAAIDAALALDPYCAPALVEDAALARSGGEIERAIGALTRLTTVVPQQPAFWFDLGVLSAEHGRPDQAHRAYTRVLALAPAHLEARFQRANLDAAAGRRAEAIADYRQCLALRPGWREALLNLGEMLLMDEQHAAAADVWQQAVQVDPQAPRTWDGLARAAKAATSSRKSSTRARSALASAVSRQPDRSPCGAQSPLGSHHFSPRPLPANQRLSPGHVEPGGNGARAAPGDGSGGRR